MSVSSSSKFLSIYDSLPPEAQKSLVDNHISSLLNSLPTGQSKQIFSAAARLQNQYSKIPDIDINTKKKEVRTLLHDLRRDGKRSMLIREQSDRTEIYAEIVDTLASWIEQIWRVVYEHKIHFSKAHEALLYISDLILEIKDLSGHGGGCKCSLVAIPVNFKIKATSGKLVKLFSYRDISSMDRILLWMWRELFISMSAHGGHQARKTVSQMLVDIEESHGWKSLGKMLHGGNCGPNWDLDDYDEEKDDEQNEHYDEDEDDEAELIDEDAWYWDRERCNEDDDLSSDSESSSDSRSHSSSSSSSSSTSSESESDLYGPCSCNLHARHWSPKVNKHRHHLRSLVIENLQALFRIDPTPEMYTAIESLCISGDDEEDEEDPFVDAMPNWQRGGDHSSGVDDEDAPQYLGDRGKEKGHSKKKSNAWKYASSRLLEDLGRVATSSSDTFSAALAIYATEGMGEEIANLLGKDGHSYLLRARDASRYQAAVVTLSEWEVKKKEGKGDAEVDAKDKGKGNEKVAMDVDAGVETPLSTTGTPTSFNDPTLPSAKTVTPSTNPYRAFALKSIECQLVEIIQSISHLLSVSFPSLNTQKNREEVKKIMKMTSGGMQRKQRVEAWIEEIGKRVVREGEGEGENGNGLGGNGNGFGAFFGAFGGGGGAGGAPAPAPWGFGGVGGDGGAGAGAAGGGGGGGDGPAHPLNPIAFAAMMMGLPVHQLNGGGGGDGDIDGDGPLGHDPFGMGGPGGGAGGGFGMGFDMGPINIGGGVGVGVGIAPVGMADGVGAMGMGMGMGPMGMGLFDMDPHDPDMDEIREEFRPRWRERFESWVETATAVKGGWVALARVYLKMISEASASATGTGTGSGEGSSSGAIGTGTAGNAGLPGGMAMVWLQGTDVVDAMVGRLTDRLSKDHVAEALEALGEFAKIQKKKKAMRQNKKTAAATAAKTSNPTSGSPLTPTSSPRTGSPSISGSGSTTASTSTQSPNAIAIANVAASATLSPPSTRPNASTSAPGLNFGAARAAVPNTNGGGGVPFSFTFGLLASSSEPGSRPAFNPREYTKRSTACQAIKRDEELGNQVVNLTLSECLFPPFLFLIFRPIHGADDSSINFLAYVDINSSANRTLLMVHGWPSLWSTWSNQIQEFKHDYHLIIPDLRGFDSSTHPGDVKTSGTLFDMVGDLKCILDDAGVASAVCVGHDWGSAVCYEAARARPDIFDGVIGAVVPYIPSAGPFVPVKELTAAIPKLTYQLFFDEKTTEAIEELDRDIRRSIRATLRTKDSPPPDEFLTSPESFLSAWNHIDEIPPVPFLTPEEEDYFVEQYKVQGFKHTLQFYTKENRHASWKFAHEQGNHTISRPVLSILPTDDPVADWALASRLLHSEDFLPMLTTKLLPGAHWVHLENSRQFNSIMREWLDEHFPTGRDSELVDDDEPDRESKMSGSDLEGRVVDEL
ncbi:hypothetical protein D9757_011761 [Collybiopsis confluens]|uniref:AB hydrolase-1 domain-containing protein n=1 Tax=Collybiopsis confluens TaxID=2823264 RepID=A0A8H5GHQ6_9AGAR|nr:hypothetical protein D9757_011761 [Collybiopsis confluens]